MASADWKTPLTKEELRDALSNIRTRAELRERWNDNPIECAKLNAKVELCDELAEELKLGAL